VWQIYRAPIGIIKGRLFCARRIAFIKMPVCIEIRLIPGYLGMEEYRQPHQKKQKIIPSH
jgi:hypothetical protein